MVKSETRGFCFEFREEFVRCWGERERESVWEDGGKWDGEKIEVPSVIPCIKASLLYFVRLCVCVCFLPLQSWLSQTECLCPQQKPFWLVSIQTLDSCWSNGRDEWWPRARWEDSQINVQFNINRICPSETGGNIALYPDSSVYLAFDLHFKPETYALAHTHWKWKWTACLFFPVIDGVFFT